MTFAAIRDCVAAIFVGSVLLACGLVTYGVLGGEDMLRAYPSRERHEGVYEFDAPDAQVASFPGADVAVGDFDGDGTADELTIDHFHMEPLFERDTWGMVYIRSGQTHDVLLAHAVDTPVPSGARWSGDLDGNGTDDLLVSDEGRQFVLGRR